MNRAEVIARLQTLELQLRERGVAAMHLFGSYARDEGGPDSDLDIFVDPIDEDAFGLVPFVETLTALQRNFPGVEIGFSTREGIAPSYRPWIEQGALRVF